MIKICRPFKNARPKSISQGFNSQHFANDFAGGYGEILVAPFNAKVANVVGEGPLDGSDASLRQGCGVRLVSIEDPTLSISYWHTLPFFPVKKGDTVAQGQFVAQMGNTGFVMSGGKYVEINIRLIPPYPGTHTHISFGQHDSVGNYTNLDYSKFIDWSIPITYNPILEMKALLQRLINLLKK